MNNKTIRISTTLRYLTVVPLIALGILSIIATGGGGGSSKGGGGITPGPTPLATGTFFRQVNTVDNGNNSIPFEARTLKLHLLYLASNILGSGNISAIRMRYGVDNPATVTCPNSTIRMGHTNVANVSTTYANNIEQGKGSMITVLDNATISIPAGTAGDWFDIRLSTSLATIFNYNGVDNLVVEFTRPSPCSAIVRVDTEDVGYTARTGERPTDADLTTAFFADAILNWIRFVFSGGDNEQNFGGAINNFWPFSSATPRIQQLYLASEIDGSGPITGIAFQMNQVSTAETYTATIMMGHSTLATLGNTFAANYSDTPVTVANAVSFSIPAGIPAGGWFWVPLPDSTFTYNGTDNLIVDVAVSAGSGNTNLRVTNVGANRRVGHDDHTAAVALGPLQIVHHAKFRFNGGTIDNIIGVGGNDASRWFTSSASGAIDQYLYRASELGTGGAITKVACRLVIPDPSVATNYANFEMVMSHTTQTTLGTDVATNLPTPVTVFSGTYSLPAALMAGDWIEVPLSTSFNYDPTQNLVIQVKSDQGTTSHSCSVLADATRFPSRRLSTANRSVATGSVFSHLKDLRIWISK